MQVAVKRLRVLDLDDVKAPNEQYAEGGSGDSMRRSSGQDSQRAMGASQAAFRQFFEREIAILASIRHPNVVNFIGGCLLRCAFLPLQCAVALFVCGMLYASSQTFFAELLVVCMGAQVPATSQASAAW